MHAFSSGVRVLLSVDERLVPTAVNEIVRFEAGGGDVEAVLAPGKDGARVPVRATLQELGEQLGSQFLRVHRAHLVNVDWIVRFDPLGDGRAEAMLRNGDRVTVSRACSIELRRAAL